MQLVEKSWEDGRSKQRVLVTLGSLDELRQSGQIDALPASGSRLSETILVLQRTKICSLGLSWSISIRRPSISMGKVERRWASTATARTTAAPEANGFETTSSESRIICSD